VIDTSFGIVAVGSGVEVGVTSSLVLEFGATLGLLIDVGIVVLGVTLIFSGTSFGTGTVGVGVEVTSEELPPTLESALLGLVTSALGAEVFVREILLVEVGEVAERGDTTDD